MNIKIRNGEYRFKFFINGKEYWCIAANDSLTYEKRSARLFFGDKFKRNPCIRAVKTTVRAERITQDDIEYIAELIKPAFENPNNPIGHTTYQIRNKFLVFI